MKGGSQPWGNGTKPLNWKGKINSKEATDLLLEAGAGHFVTRTGSFGICITVRLNRNTPIGTWKMVEESKNVKFIPIQNKKLLENQTKTVSYSTIAAAIEYLISPNGDEQSNIIFGVHLITNESETKLKEHLDMVARLATQADYDEAGPGNPPHYEEAAPGNPAHYDEAGHGNPAHYEEAGAGTQYNLASSGRGVAHWALPPSSK